MYIHSLHTTIERWVGRVALVTGASAGFGEAIAKRLVKLGLKVVGCARNLEKLKVLEGSLQNIAGSFLPIQCDVSKEDMILAMFATALEGSLQNEAGSFLPIQCDVSKEDQILAMFATIQEKLGGVDICINNAGLSHNAPLLTGKTEDWRHMLEVNVLGLCICTREAFKSMQARNVDDGHIVLLSSMSGHRVLNDPAGHMYAATKFAVKALMEGIRNELVQRKSHIRVTSISPGLAKTEFMYRQFEDEPEKADAKYSSCETMTADDIVDSIIYALSAPPRVQVHDILIRPTDCLW